MKLFAALLAASTIAVVAPTTAQASCGNGGGPPSNGCNIGGSFTDNSGNDRGNDFDIEVGSNGVYGSENDIDYSGTRVNGNRNVTIDGKNNRVNTGPVTREVDRSNTATGGAGGAGLGVGIAGANAAGGEGGDATIQEGAIDNRNKNKNTNTAEGGKAVQGQAQGQAQGQQQGITGSGNSSSGSAAAARGGDQSQSQSSRSTSGVRNSGNSRNSNRTSTSTSTSSSNTNSTSSSSSADNNGNSQTLNYTNIDIPEATVAPLTPNGVPGQVGDVVVPLPSITGGAFISEDDGVYGINSRNTRGVTLGFQLPLGTGQVRRAAEQVIARRERADRFQLIQEATWMLQQGVLSEEAHPEHWAALYGEPEVVSLF